MYYDLLPKIKNAGLAKKEFFTTSYSKNDLEIAKLLVQEGYLKDVHKKTVGKKNYLEIKVSFNKNKSVLNNFKLISKPSRRLYFGYSKIRPVKQGYGIGFISTSKGIMIDKEARKNKVGGEYLFEIW